MFGTENEFKANRDIPHDHAKFGETYHGHRTSHQLLQKFKVDILKYFKVCSAPFLLTR